MHTITLSDGSRIENLKMNGNNFISPRELKKEAFEGKLSTVTIEDGESEVVYEDMELMALQQYDDGWYFVLTQKSPAEKAREKYAKDITDLQEAITNVYEQILGGGT